MDNLLISYGISKTKKITNIIIGGYLACFTLYFCIMEAIASRFDILFFCALIGLVLAIILILSNSLWLSEPFVKIDGNTIESNPPTKNRITIDWARISKVNIGMSYITFAVNGGQKQLKMELSYLTYNDMVSVKSKIIEFCEYKNIPYQND